MKTGPPRDPGRARDPPVGRTDWRRPCGPPCLRTTINCDAITTITTIALRWSVNCPLARSLAPLPQINLIYVGKCSDCILQCAPILLTAQPRRKASHGDCSLTCQPRSVRRRSARPDDPPGAFRMMATPLVAAGGAPRRLRREAAFASPRGVNPVPASSDRTDRHRLKGSHPSPQALLGPRSVFHPAQI